MERHTLRALLSIGALVLLAWAGIVLVAKLHSGGGSLALIVVCVLLAAAVLGFALRSIGHARRARLERRPETTRGRR